MTSAVGAAAPPEAAKRIDLGPYADWTEPERLILNVERAYRELRGEPWDAPIDRGDGGEVGFDVERLCRVVGFGKAGATGFANRHGQRGDRGPVQVQVHRLPHLGAESAGIKRFQYGGDRRLALAVGIQ